MQGEKNSSNCGGWVMYSWLVFNFQVINYKHNHSIVCKNHIKHSWDLHSCTFTSLLIGIFDCLKKNSKFKFAWTYTHYGYIRTTVKVSVLVVLIFSQNFSTNGPYVVLIFCKFSDYMVLIFEKKSHTAYYVFQIGNY